jgi:hypothetical protein
MRTLRKEHCHRRAKMHLFFPGVCAWQVLAQNTFPIAWSAFDRQPHNQPAFHTLTEFRMMVSSLCSYAMRSTLRFHLFASEQALS